MRCHCKLLIAAAGVTFLLACSMLLPAGSKASGGPGSPLEPAAEFYPRPTESAAKLAAALDKKISLEFHKSPLSEVADWLQRELGVPVVIDRRSLSDAGLQPSEPITFKLSEVSARNGLELLFVGMDITILEKDEYLLVTMQDRAEDELITRVYPVGDLVPEKLIPLEWAGAMPRNHRDASPQFKAPAHEAVMIKSADYESLIDLIGTTVRPQVWDLNQIVPNSQTRSIVVIQTHEVHGAILELLRALRAAKQVSEAAETR